MGPYTIIYNQTSGAVYAVYPSVNNGPAVADALARFPDAIALANQILPEWLDPFVSAGDQLKIVSGAIAPLDADDLRPAVKARALAIAYALIGEYYTPAEQAVALTDGIRIAQGESGIGLWATWEARLVQLYSNLQTVYTQIDAHSDPAAITDAQIRTALLTGIT